MGYLNKLEEKKKKENVALKITTKNNEKTL